MKKSKTKHTQSLLAEKGDIATVANRQRLTKLVGRDTVDGTVERIRPDFMFRSVLLGGYHSDLRYHAHGINPLPDRFHRYGL